MPAELGQRVLGENLRYQAHPSIDLEVFAITGGNTGAFLAPVLKSKQSEKGESGYIFAVAIDSKNTAALMQLLPSLLIISLLLKVGQCLAWAFNQSITIAIALASCLSLCPAPGISTICFGSPALSYSLRAWFTATTPSSLP